MDNYYLPGEYFFKSRFIGGFDNNLNKKVGTLSFGETKKLEFLRLIIENKNVWILDEPFSNLDFFFHMPIEF